MTDRSGIMDGSGDPREGSVTSGPVHRYCRFESLWDPGIAMYRELQPESCV
jgi:hypothetical protein